MRKVRVTFEHEGYSITASGTILEDTVFVNEMYAEDAAGVSVPITEDNESEFEVAAMDALYEKHANPDVFDQLLSEYL